MTRIDLTTREWHGLIAPVLPHASTDAELPELNAIRVEAADGVLYAVGTDRYTLGVSRHVLAEPCDDLVIHVDREDAATMLRLFGYTKDDDPPLRVTVDKVPLPVKLAGHPATVTQLGMTIDREDGTRLVLHDKRNPMHPNAMASWRKWLTAAVSRDLRPAAPVLLLTPKLLARWAKAASAGERLTFLAGPEPTDPVLILVEDHFAGVIQPAGHLDTGSEELVSETPWRRELAYIAQGAS